MDGTRCTISCPTTEPPEQGDLDDWIFKANGPRQRIRQALERHRTSAGRFARSLYWSQTTFGLRCRGRPSITPDDGSWPVLREGQCATVLWSGTGKTPVLPGLQRSSGAHFRSDSNRIERLHRKGLASNKIFISVEQQAINRDQRWFHVLAPRPFDTYLSWRWKDDAGKTLARSSVLWCLPSSTPPRGINA